MPPSVIAYQRGFAFDLAPDLLWDRIEEIDQFERWWPWLTDLRIEGNGLSAGSVLHGVVTPPLPYRMRLDVELVECDRPTAIDATISGDLTGQARLRLRPRGDGTWAEVAWEVEMRQPAMRIRQSARPSGPAVGTRPCGGGDRRWIPPAHPAPLGPAPWDGPGPPPVRWGPIRG